MIVSPLIIVSHTISIQRIEVATTDPFSHTPTDPTEGGVTTGTDRFSIQGPHTGMDMDTHMDMDMGPHTGMDMGAGMDTGWEDATMAPRLSERVLVRIGVAV
ncbi:uncharacterized protein METZ01_LOCUS454946 [marine metagenome]|uniref:Uncharacterized protein n=1 Tax=marine metagenome TaxID=408172 RepID=A0A383A2X4_9ZZZZ